MADVVISGNRVLSLIQVTILELEAEANALLDRALVEKARLVATGQATEAQAEEAIKQTIIAGTDFANSWNNNIDKVVREMGKQLVAQPVRTLAQQDTTAKFKWVLGSVKSVHCPDCLRLSGMGAKTVAGWEAEGFGLPRDGLTICNVGCRCMLSPL